MAETKKTYTIPLRKTFLKAAPLKRGPKAVRAIKAYLQKHCKAEGVKLGAKLNTQIWARGITNPPHKVIVDVIIADNIAKAELAGFTYVEAKKIEKKTEPQTFKEKLAEKMGAKAGAGEEAKPSEEQPKAEEKEEKQEVKPSEEKKASEEKPAKSAEKLADKQETK